MQAKCFCYGIKAQPFEVMLFRYGFSRPIINSAEFHNVCIALRRKLFRRLLASVSASAVNHYKLFLIGQFGNILCTDGFVWNIYRSGDMLAFILLGRADI